MGCLLFGWSLRPKDPSTTFCNLEGIDLIPARLEFGSAS